MEWRFKRSLQSDDGGFPDAEHLGLILGSQKQADALLRHFGCSLSRLDAIHCADLAAMHHIKKTKQTVPRGARLTSDLTNKEGEGLLRSGRGLQPKASLRFAFQPVSSGSRRMAKTSRGLIIHFGTSMGEGSRPRPAAAGLSPKPRVVISANENHAFGSWHVLAAREDARRPGADSD